MRVKVCGVTRPQDAALACRLGAWAVGLVFAPASPRRLDLAAARRVRDRIASGVFAVGVFQDPSREEVLAAIEACRLDAVQLHGGQSPEACRDFPVPVFKAFGLSVAKAADVRRYDVAAVIVEPRRTDSDRMKGKAPAAIAQRQAWKAAAALKGQAPLVILAGGLTPENVAEAVGVSQPGAVDVSSGIEKTAGVKDLGKMRAFFKALRYL